MTVAPPVVHYENFPVASWLCPPHLRPAIRAIYHFARTADDLADEGNASAPARLADLSAYREALCNAVAGARVHGRWAGVFSPLQRAIEQHALPAALLHNLLSAFEQDVRQTASGQPYASTHELLAYCALSANPIGRLLLHLYGIHQDTLLQQSDQICSALQLINFWQDLSVDLPRGRVYLPHDVLQRHGLQMHDFLPGSPQEANAQSTAQQAAVRDLCTHAAQMMHAGAPLAHHIPGLAGWELRLVIQGGLRILQGIAKLDYRSWLARPTLRKTDGPRLLWRALCMRAH